MIDDVCQDVKAQVDGVVSAKAGELEERPSKFLSSCATEVCVRDEADSLKELLGGVETWFREEHAALVDAIGAHTAAMNAQTALLEALCGKVKAVKERVDSLLTRVVLVTSSGTLRQSPGQFKALPTGRTLFHPS